MVPAPMTIVFSVAYDGAPFSGFAKQKGGVPTVQGSLEDALRCVLRRDVETVGAGRTDAGVHALGQVVSMAADGTEPELGALVRSLNGLTGPGIVVTGARYAPSGFSARFDAEAREYRYRIVPGPVPPLFLRDVSWWVKPRLEIAAMRQAASALLGEHDFRSFCVTDSAQSQRTVRRVDLIDIAPAVEMGEHCLVVRVGGNAFLHSMVRVIAGSLVEVGSGRRDPGWVAEVLAARDRSSAGPTAPAKGLTLWHVSYPEECWL